MSLWIPYFSITFILLILSSGIPNISWYENQGMITRDWNSKKRLFIIIVIVLAIFCAFKSIQARSIDEYAYRNRFLIYKNFNFLTALNESNGEYINGTITWVTSRIFKTSQGIFIVFGSLSSFLYLFSLKKYSGNFSYAVALLMCMGIINVSFNITQQSLGCALFVVFSYLIYEKKLIKYLLLVLCCFFIHNSAVILLPLYFCYGEDKQNKTGSGIKPYILLGSLILFFAYSNLSFIADRIPLFGQYVDRAEGFNGVTTNFLTVLINCVPALIVFLTEKLIDKKDKITILSGNMCLVHAAIYAVALIDNYVARLALYTAPFCVIFLSRSLKYFNKDSRKIIILVSIIFYSIELYLRMRGSIYIFNFSF